MGCELSCAAEAQRNTTEGEQQGRDTGFKKGS